jgi:hypothetical protein
MAFLAFTRWFIVCSLFNIEDPIGVLSPKISKAIALSEVFGLPGFVSNAG